MWSITVVHPASGHETISNVLKLTPRTIVVDWDGSHKVFTRSTGAEWGYGQGWRIADEDLARLAAAPGRWEAQREPKPRPNSWYETHSPWLPEGANVTDMPLGQLRHLGYVDESSIDRDEHGELTWDYSEKGWDNFTPEDHRRFTPRNTRSSDDAAPGRVERSTVQRVQDAYDIDDPDDAADFVEDYISGDFGDD